LFPAALQHQCRLEGKEERNEVDDGSDPHCFEAGLHGWGFCNRGCGEGAQRYGRRDEGEHAPIEDEHVDGHRIEPDLDQGRRQQDRQEDIGRGGCHADAKYEPGQGAHQQQEDLRAIGYP